MNHSISKNNVNRKSSIFLFLKPKELQIKAIPYSTSWNVGRDFYFSPLIPGITVRSPEKMIFNG
jgi:hypothetical protein